MFSTSYKIQKCDNYITTWKLGNANKFLESKRYWKIFGTANIKGQAKKEGRQRLHCPNRPGRYQNQLVRFLYFLLAGPSAQAQGKQSGRFFWLFRTDWVSKSVLDLFWCGKLGERILDLFPTGIRPPPLYILEDHGWLSYPTSNRSFLHLLSFLPYFSNLLPFGGSLREIRRHSSWPCRS